MDQEPPRGAAIERVEVRSAADFRRRMAEARPFIVTGEATSWDACKRWNIDYFRSAAGHREVEVEVYPEHYFDFKPSRNVRMSMDEYLDLLVTSGASGVKHYLAGRPIQRMLPELARDIPLPSFFDDELKEAFSPEQLQRRLMAMHVFIGRDCASPAHYHPWQQAILCQIHGKKRVVLYSPEQTPAMYARSWYRPHAFFSDVNFADLDYQQYPALRNAEPVECTLNAGEILFIPIHWWHVVFGLDLSASVTMFWDAPFGDWRFPQPGFRTLAIRCLETLREMPGRLVARRR
jgi:hypothetical protein